MAKQDRNNPHTSRKARKEQPYARSARKDGQAALNRTVYENLAQDAWFPALYADEIGAMDFDDEFPEV